MGYRDSIWGFDNENINISVDLIPEDTSPRSETLLLQPEAKFALKCDFSDYKFYSGVLDIQTPDPFEVKNRGRPNSMGWDSDDGEISVEEAKGLDIILMKVILPSQYRGKKLGKIEIFERVGDEKTKRCEHRLKSDPPLTHTSSEEQ